MKITILTLFPKMFEGFLNESIMKRAIDNNLIDIKIIDFREYSLDKHKRVDDIPYGGGAGMVLTPQPLFDAIEDVKNYDKILKIFLTPQGQKLDNKLAKELANEEELLLVCGHYEGFDERIRENFADKEISIGDYVLTGGELAAMVVVDALSRFIPNVLGSDESHTFDSFEDNLLEHPHYTRPQNFRGLEVPQVLYSGNHKEIEKWRKEQSQKRTKERRKDLINK